MGRLTYLVDTEGIIKRIGGPWDKFAEANGNRSLSVEVVLGSDLFSHISGESVRQIYHDMHELLWREPERTISFSYRCDGVTVRRLMTMELRREGREILYTSAILKETPQEKPLEIDYAPDSGELLLLCAWCKAYDYPMNSDNWRPIETIFENAPTKFTVSHSICPSCHNRMLRSLSEPE